MYLKDNKHRLKFEKEEKIFIFFLLGTSCLLTLIELLLPNIIVRWFICILLALIFYIVSLTLLFKKPNKKNNWIEKKRSSGEIFQSLYLSILIILLVVFIQIIVRNSNLSFLIFYEIFSYFVLLAILCKLFDSLFFIAYAFIKQVLKSK